MPIFNYSDNKNSSNAPLSSLLFSQIQKDILLGNMRSGEKLTEQRICDRYNVSRTPVREALRQLEKESLIKNIPNRGAFVIGFTNQDVVDLLDLRSTYEVQAVKWAVERITDDEMEALEETFEFMEFYTMKKDVEKMLNININFHQNIYKASHNRMLLNTLSSYQIYTRYTNDFDYDDPGEYLNTALSEHRKIFDGIRDKNLEMAVKAMEEHMSKSRERRLSRL